MDWYTSRKTGREDREGPTTELYNAVNDGLEFVAWDGYLSSDDEPDPADLLSSDYDSVTTQGILDSDWELDSHNSE